MSRGAAGEPTLCWDCKNAAKPWACEWVGSGKPVNGWWAKPTTMKGMRGMAPIESYHVVRCPKFKRGSFGGGLTRDTFGKHEFIKLDDKDTVNLAEAIIQSAVEDWQSLKFGELSVVNKAGKPVFKADVLEFFFSRWFERLLESFSAHTPQQIRSYIHITEDMRPNKGVT